MSEASAATTAANTAKPAASLARELGLADSISLIMGIMVGSGIFLMAGSVALQLNSLAAVVAVWALGGVLSICGAVSLSELGAMYPAAGGLYVYLREAYGDCVAFVYGWSAMALIHAGSIATLAAGVGLYAAPMLGLSTLQRKVLQVACIAAFTIINCFRLGVGKWVQNVLTVAKLGGLVAMVVLLYWRGNTHLLQQAWMPADASFRWVPFGVALTAVLWAFDGWHFVSFAAGEVKQPEKTLPRALILGASLTFVLYMVVNLSYYAVLPVPSIAGNNRVAASAVEFVYGAGASTTIAALIILSMLGAMNGIVLGAPRINWAMAKDGLFFRSFARVHPSFRTPVVAMLAQGAWAIVFTLSGSFQELFTSYVFTSWIFYGLCVAGVIVLRRRNPHAARPYRVPLYPWTPIFFLVATCGIVLGTFLANFHQAALGVGLIALGLPLYFCFRWLERNRTVAVAD